MDIQPTVESIKMFAESLNSLIKNYLDKDERVEVLNLVTQGCCKECGDLTPKCYCGSHYDI